MRKQYKLKKRSCPMCKPHKMGWDKRFEPKDLDRLKRDVAEMRQFCNKT